MKRAWIRGSAAFGAAGLLAAGSLIALPAYAQTAVTAAIDPATGKLRPIEHDDAKAQASASQQRAAFGAAAKPAAPLQQRMTELAAGAQTQYHANGARSRVLSPARHAYSVATLNADGSISTTCLHGEDAAAHALHTQPAAATRGAKNVE